MFICGGVEPDVRLLVDLLGFRSRCCSSVYSCSCILIGNIIMNLQDTTLLHILDEADGGDLVT